MTERQYLAYLLDPFNVAPPVYVVCDDGGACHRVAESDLSLRTGPVITFNAAALVDALRTTASPLPAALVDIHSALRLRSGLSQDQGGARSWNIWNALKRYYERPQDADTFRELFETKIKRPSDEDVVRLLSSTATALKYLWDAVLRDLEWQRELRRLFDLEIPVQQVFFARQYSGIVVNVELAEKFTLDARNGKYTAFREVATALNLSPTGLSFRTIGPLLKRTDAQHLQEWQDAANLRDYFEVAQETSSFASAFLRFIDFSNDLDVLTAVLGSEGRVFPTFDCFGTVTGRILASNPRLQQLRRRFRGILAADKGKELLYVDYAQFEPGILAAVSKDVALRALYNTQDLYRTLSLAVFGTPDNRDVCKKIFLAYCYGMSVEKIARLLAGPDFSLERLTECAESVRRFFAEFPELVRYRGEAAERLEENGYVETVFGNRRIRKSTGPLTTKERRWASNQFVQGSASVVFKQAILDIVASFGGDCVLLPMHDAVLLQYNNAECSGDDFEREVSRIMSAAFRRWIPDVEPKVVRQDFAVPWPL